MAIITLVSAAGSPGVTTSALGLALAWPRRALLVEADPTGGSALLAGFWRGQRDHTGLLDLVMAHRAGVLAEAVPRIAVEVDDSECSVLVGTKSHEQAHLLAGLWDPLLGVLRDLAGQDVIVDAGRLGLDGSPRPLITYSDLTLLVTHSSLRALAAARSWAKALGTDVLPGHAVQLLLVGDGRPYRSSEVARTLGLPVAGAIEWDPRRAAVFSDGEPHPPARFGGEQAAGRAFDHSQYVRGLRSVAESLSATLRGEAELRGEESLA
jgi:hypothetical protein